MKTFEKVLGTVTDKTALVSQVALVACMVLVVSDIARRSLGFGEIPGVPELVEIIAAVILSIGIGYLTFVRGHVAVDVLVIRFRPRVQAVFELITCIMALGITVLLTWGVVKYAMYRQASGSVTGLLQIPIYPFIYIVAASLALTCVVLIRDVVKAVIMLRTRGGP